MAIRLKPTDLVVHGNRLLRLYSYYSLFLALLLLISNTLDKQNAIIGGTDPTVFLIGCTIYVVAAAAFAVVANRQPDPQIAISYVFAEIALLSALMFASGGLASGFSSLILIPVAIANLLAPGVLGFGVAAWTTLAIFYTQNYWMEGKMTHDLINSGLYGLLCFVIAGITQTLSKRLKSALSLATDQETRLRRLHHFSRQALLNLPNGIIACDKNDEILFFNNKAMEWFDLIEGENLPDLLYDSGENSIIESGSDKLLLKRVPLNDSEPGDYLIYVENTEIISQEAQHVKLAALGRLTASIAHEIRNPLSALRQAAQLLSEAPELQQSEKQLTQIIEQQCMRINRTIEDVLSLSRRSQSTAETLRLSPWLQHFAKQLQQVTQADHYKLSILCPDDIQVRFDPGQLQQILHNLCTNGLRYAVKAAGERARLAMIATISDVNSIYLDIIDNGNGVAPEQRPHLFEPFYTTEHSGTGLGLYLCRELCEANHARIQYYPIPNGTCFRIIMKSA